MEVVIMWCVWADDYFCQPEQWSNRFIVAAVRNTGFVPLVEAVMNFEQGVDYSDVIWLSWGLKSLAKTNGLFHSLLRPKKWCCSRSVKFTLLKRCILCFPYRNCESFIIHYLNIFHWDICGNISCNFGHFIRRLRVTGKQCIEWI